MNNLYFQINNGEEQQFAQIPEGESFKIEFTKFPTKEDLEKSNYYFLFFTDKEGNKFKIYSKPE